MERARRQKEGMTCNERAFEKESRCKRKQEWLHSHTHTRDTLQHTATYCNILQHTATHCNTLKHTATYCNILQHTAIHCNTLQHTATHCNTLQHIERERECLHPHAHARDTRDEMCIHIETQSSVFSLDCVFMCIHIDARIYVCMYV